MTTLRDDHFSGLANITSTGTASLPALYNSHDTRIVNLEAVSGGFTPTAIKVGAYTALRFQTVQYDPSAGQTLTLPFSPAAGDQVRFQNATTDVTEITLAGNGKDLENPLSTTIAIATTQLYIPSPRASVTYEYNGTEWVRIASAEYPLAPPISGLIKIRKPSDFGTPVGGVYTLFPFAIYEIESPVNLGTDRLEGNNVSFRGNGTFLATISSATTGAVFKTNADGFVFMNGIAIQNAVGSCFDIALGVTALSVISIATCFFSGLNTGSIGIINGSNRFTTITSFFLDFDEGLVLDGVITEMTLNNTLFATVAGATAYTAITVNSTATIKAALLVGVSFTSFNAADTGINIHASATLTTAFRISGCLYQGLGTFIDPAGIQNSSPGLITTANIGVDDSTWVGSLIIVNNSSVTTFASQGVHYTIGTGTPAHTVYALDAGSERFVLEGDEAQNQLIRYKGTITRVFKVDVQLEMDKGGGGSLTIEVCIFKNGSLIVGSETATEVTSTATFGATIALVSLATNDTLQICVSNETSTNNITVTSARLVAVKV